MRNNEEGRMQDVLSSNRQVTRIDKATPKVLIPVSIP